MVPHREQQVLRAGLARGAGLVREGSRTTIGRQEKRHARSAWRRHRRARTGSRQDQRHDADSGGAGRGPGEQAGAISVRRHAARWSLQRESRRAREHGRHVGHV